MSNFPDDIRAGSLQVRLAAGAGEVRAAQKLRYRVFVEECGAGACDAAHAAKEDSDAFDDHCDHLLVLEHGSADGPRVVGTYRLLLGSRARRYGRFYTADEFDISAMLSQPGEILELGRSCVDAGYRNRAVMQLLWRGIGAYVAMHNVSAMFGCASFHGTSPAPHAEALSYLHYWHSAPEDLRLKALPERFVSMELMPREEVNAKVAFSALPPLIKGYLRLGGFVSDGAVIDCGYNTLDVGIVVKTDRVTDKYAQRYGRESAEC